MATTKQTNRRRNALQRLEAQLASGKKTVKKSFTEKTELTDADAKRIHREIDRLKMLT